jgi:hypothetical protein
MLLRELVLLGVAPVARAEGPPPEARTALIIGFEVIKETDADQAKMVAAVRYTRKL